MRKKHLLFIILALSLFSNQSSATQQNSRFFECGTGYINSLVVQYFGFNVNQIVLIADLDTAGIPQPAGSSGSRLSIIRRGNGTDGNTDQSWESMRQTLTTAMTNRLVVRLGSQTSGSGASGRCRDYIDRTMVRLCTSEALCTANFVEP